jgi:hypothetical protein
MIGLLLVRADDLVVLGVEADGFELAGDRLVAVADGAVLTVAFPPQAVSEGKTEDASIQGGLQGERSTVRFGLPVGAEVPLDVAGFLELLATLDIPVADTTRIELPARLVQRPAVPARGSGPAQPVTADGVTGLWEYVVGPTGPGPLMLVAHDVLGGDRDSDVTPLDFDNRSTIKNSGIPSTVERLRLSALGGTLAAGLVSEAIEWDHVTALGRDQRVRFQQRGILHPFGHPAVLTVTAVRRVTGETAALHRETVLRVVDPIRRLPAPDSVASRAFPFSEAELLTTTLPGIGQQNHVPPFTRPPDVTDLMVQRQLAAGVELETARTDLGAKYVQPIPQDELALEGHPLDRQNAMDFRQAGREAQALEEEKARIIADGTIVTDDIPPQEFVPQHVFDAANALNPQIRERQAAEAAAHQRFVTFDLPFLQSVVPTQAELANGDLYARRLATLGDQIAQTIVQLLDELARIATILGPEAAAPVVSRVLDPPGGGGHPVRLRGRLGDVVVHVPLHFVHDLRVPADEFFGGYSSLDDPFVVAGLPPVSGELPGVPIDLVRRPGAARTTDVQEVHAVSVGAVKEGREVRPVLHSFVVELPELRTLLPGAATRVRARLDSAYLDGGEARNVIRLDTAVKVNFDEQADRGGALMTPSFEADVVSDEFGPVDRRMLPGGGDPMAALANMRMFGIPLGSLLGGFTAPPSILQIPGPDGVPRGVTLSWPEQKLKTSGPFLARAPGPDGAPDTTTVRLTVTQDLTTRSTECILTAFTLRLPTPQTEVLRLSFGGLIFREGSGRPPTFEVASFDFSFEGSLRLIKNLQEKASALLGGSKPQVELRDTGVTAIFALRVPDASSGAFLMRNIVVHIGVHIPFRGGSPGVQIAFASREAPFQLSIPPFGGGGYAAVALEGSRLTELDISMEFGGMISADFKIVKAEVHALGGVRSALVGGDVRLAGFIRLGGSISLFGLASVSIEMRIELIYDGTRNHLAGRATLVIELDLTLYSDKVELDSGLWVLAGGASPPPPPDLGSPVAQRGWSTYQGAYA